MEYKLRPGMITLTWTSMNIDAYKHHIHTGLVKLEELINNINDIVENRVEKNMKTVSKTVSEEMYNDLRWLACSFAISVQHTSSFLTRLRQSTTQPIQPTQLLVDLPKDESFTVDSFLARQEAHVRKVSGILQDYNVMIERAIDDIILVIQGYQLDPHIEPPSMTAIEGLKNRYNRQMYMALRKAVTNSFNAVKKRVGSRGSSGFLFVERPFFEVDVQLAVPAVRLSPTLDEIQHCINKTCSGILKSMKDLFNWGQADVPLEEKESFFDLITNDLAIVKVILLLTGSIQGLRNQVKEYLESFLVYDWLWKADMEHAYIQFMAGKPTLIEYKSKLMEFEETEAKIGSIVALHNIGALSLNTRNLKLQLMHEASHWKVKFSSQLHVNAKAQMQNLVDYIKTTNGQLQREVTDLDSLAYMMDKLKEIRERESGVEMEISPILEIYGLLENFVDHIDKDEMDQKSVLRSSWTKLVDYAERVTDNLTAIQLTYRRKLLKDIKIFKVEVADFKNAYDKDGPGVSRIVSSEAKERERERERSLDTALTPNAIIITLTTETKGCR